MLHFHLAIHAASQGAEEMLKVQFYYHHNNHNNIMSPANSDLLIEYAVSSFTTPTTITVRITNAVFFMMLTITATELLFLSSHTR